MSVHKILNSLGLQEISGLLIKRGTAMGPLVPILLISLVLLFFSWFFKSTLVIESTLVIDGIPLITVACVLAALWLIIKYTRHYAWFAKHDPDRLQSEEYRYEIARLNVITTQGLSDPMPADELPAMRRALPRKQGLSDPMSADELSLADTAPNPSKPEESRTPTDDKEKSP